jgi:Asp-tRNA(Asn)/Glu-tRNA(Gln) amidotransferase A subunit family amidase
VTLSLKEFTRLKGLMALTTSDSDYEAVSAIRAANRILADHGLTWDRVFARTVTVISEMSGQVVGEDRDDDLEALFEAALASASEGSSFRDTLLSIYETYRGGGRLSPKQREVVERAAERAEDRAEDRRPGRRVR